MSDVPSHEGIRDMLPSLLVSGSEKCPLCGHCGIHEHSPAEIVIYRNGIKYGRVLGGEAPELRKALSELAIRMDIKPYPEMNHNIKALYGVIGEWLRIVQRVLIGPEGGACDCGYEEKLLDEYPMKEHARTCPSLKGLALNVPVGRTT